MAEIPVAEPPPPAPARPPTHNYPEGKARLPWAALGIEAFAVFLSVLAGFALTAWLENRHEDVLRETALENFVREIERNHAAVEARLPYHAAVFEAINRVVAAPPPTVDAALEAIGFEGPRWAGTTTTAQATADATGALALLDFETAGAITRAYQMQAGLADVNERFLAASLSPSSFSDETVAGTLRALQTYFAIVLEFENNLTSRFYPDAARAAREALGEAPADSSDTP